METTVVRAEKMAAGGDAIAHIDDGRVAFVHGALPGELVAVEIVQAKKDYVKAELVEVVEASVDRVVPPCPAHAIGCGGCPWQHVRAESQLTLKQAVVTEALRRTGKIAEPVVEVGSSVPPWEYRTTLRLATSGRGRLGLRRRGSHDVVELAGCPVAHPMIDELLGSIRVTGEGEVSLRVGAATGERSAWVAQGDVELVGVPAGVGVGPQAVVHEVVGGRTFRISAASFFQSGPAAAQLLVDAVGRACGEWAGTDLLVDAYGGVGLFAAAVGHGRVTLIEGSEPACADARANLVDRHAEIVCTSVEAWAPRSAELVVADPPRTGLGKRAAAVLTATQASRIVLVSCDPVALARDAGLLRELGYDHVRSTVFDLFPQTPHVEVVTTFDRR